jgi:hypothetical protein
LRSTFESVGTLGRWVISTCLVLLAPPSLGAQVGLTASLAQVTLVARTAPRGSIQGVSAAREIGGSGALRESSVALGISANTSFRLVARHTGVFASRIWVRSVAGNFEELKAGLPVVVARDSCYHGNREVQYRTETPAGETQDILPIVYDLVIAPTM